MNADTMTTRCTLETEGYHVAFHLQQAPRQMGFVDGVIELTLLPELGGASFRSAPTFLSANDLQRLVTYLEEHVAHLRSGANGNGFPLVPSELGFQVAALGGDVEADEGEFTLRFLVNVGQPDGRSATYAGAEAVVTVQQVRKFTASLDAVLGALASTK